MTDQPKYNGVPIEWCSSLDDPESTEFYWPQRMKDDPPAVGQRVYIVKDPDDMNESQKRFLAHFCSYYELPAELREL